MAHSARQCAIEWSRSRRGPRSDRGNDATRSARGERRTATTPSIAEALRAPDPDGHPETPRASTRPAFGRTRNEIPGASTALALSRQSLSAEAQSSAGSLPRTSSPPMLSRRVLLLPLGRGKREHRRNASAPRIINPAPRRPRRTRRRRRPPMPSLRAPFEQHACHFARAAATTLLYCSKVPRHNELRASRSQDRSGRRSAAPPRCEYY